MRILCLLLLIFLSFGFMINSAEAKRFGGGASFGMQRAASHFTAPAAINTASSFTRPAAHSWLGPLAGMAAGGLLTYFLMGHGVGSGLLSWLAIAGVVFFLLNLLRARRQPVTEMSNNIPFTPNQPYFTPVNNTSAPFDTEAFLRQAKVQFIRLQAAYDQKNLMDLQTFTTPAVFAEIKMQLDERGLAPNQTEVISLNTQLLETALDNQATLASVRFSGVIKENVNTEAAEFQEIWHFRKELNQTEWLVAGVQQV